MFTYLHVYSDIFTVFPRARCGLKVEIVGQGQDSYGRSAVVLRRAVDVAVGPQSSELVNARPFVKRQSWSVQHRRITSPHYQLENKLPSINNRDQTDRVAILADSYRTLSLTCDLTFSHRRS